MMESKMDEKLLAAASDLVAAVRFADPPRKFNGVLCHEARVPVEFVKAVEDALAARDKG